MRGNGERIGPQNLPTSSVAGGIWNLLNQQRAQQRGAWPSATPAVVTDPYFMYVPLLLNTTSTNGQQNNTFLDSSSNAFTITRNGTPTQGAFTPYQPSGYWSGYFNGTTDYLTVPASSALTLTADFTIEFWVYSGAFASGASNPSLFNNVSASIFYESNGSNRGLCLYVGSAIITTAITVLPNNQWNHVVCVRSGSTVSMYVNGSRVGTNAAFSSTADFSSAYINRYYGSAAGYLNGYMSNLRVVKGTAVYDPTLTTLTVPTTPLTAITNTSLLTLQSNRFIDNSSNAFAITVNGTPKVQAFQPFSPAASYSAATYGGSGYFNGSTDYLDELTANTAFNLSSGDWTIEAWVYRNAASANHLILNLYNSAGSNSGLTFYINSSNQLVTDNGTVAALSGGSVPANQWVHLAIVRSSGTTTGYVNGVSIGTNTQAPATAQYARIGSLASSLYYFNGYISNLRVVKGTAIVPPAGGPTSPVTAVSGTSLLTNFTNAGIYDAAWQNNVTTVGDAQVSTTITAKWPPTSMKFDGTGDYLDLGSNQAFVMGSGNWTVESWVYPTSTSPGHWMYLQGNSTAFGAIRIGCQSNQVFLLISTNGTSFTVSSGLVGSVPINTWTYLAVTRSGGTVTLYVNGTSIYTSTALSTSSLMTGIYNLVGRIDPTNLQYFNGYIQDLRITKGVARTITTPTAAFPTR
jgi:hypothetical protein